jgi:hypothetical protein
LRGDNHGWLREQLGLEVGYDITVRYLHELGYNLPVPRPWPERQNEEHRNGVLRAIAVWQADTGLELCLPTNKGGGRSASAAALERSG